MLVTKISDHVKAALKRFLYQYQSIPAQYTLPLNDGSTIAVSALTGFMAALADQAQDLENAIFDSNVGRQLYDGATTPAVGTQLDNLGALIGLPRNGLSDNEYTAFLFGVVAEDYSDSTMETILTGASLLFQVSNVIGVSLKPAAFGLQVSDATPMPASLHTAAANVVQNTLGGGIGLEFISTFPAASAFRFGYVGGPQIGGGFAGAGGAGGLGGGGFAQNIYTNSGA